MESKAEGQRLLSLWRGLAPPDRETLLQFAEFLTEKSRRNAVPEVVVPEYPLNIPAPPGESAVKALKRLKKSYPMIDADISLLEKASQILMQKVLGAPDKEVIEQMERLFQEHYRQWQEGRRPQ
ncbi:MAG: hypothetical protein HQL63_07025 [Magnetococcales bacterium]|nr:hypothetical protein [Magnetococcales bacterium]MBF0321945.1 hypothetical protein [Magnetococcales bacterium]